MSIDGDCSFMCNLLLVTVQGSILGPLPYAIYVTPQFDDEHLLAFAAGRYIPKFGDSIT
jgi:hypothetical protein